MLLKVLRGFAVNVEGNCSSIHSIAERSSIMTD